MCGIAGIYSTGGAPDENVVRRMIAITRHRGPDDHGYYSQGPVSLGQCRLSIIDLERGKQPIYNEDKSICVVYNGEIYNFPELTRELKEKGHVFTTATDTETIVHAYEEYGLDCLLKFNGMFAFALWDSREKKLLLARDRLGIKPLYFAEGPWGLAFASEAKAFLAIDGFTPEVNPFALADFLMYQNILDEKSFFKRVTKLKAGHYVVVSEAGRMMEKYWDLEFNEDGAASFDDVLDRYRHTYTESVRRHLISDVPLGVHLSGGLDSTSVATLAMKITGRPIVSFTGYFSEHEQYDEREYANSVINKIGALPQEIHITHEDFKRDLQRVVYHLDEPSVGSGALPQFTVARRVKQHVKVALTGHGGDELFAGYQVFKSAHYKELLKRNPASIFGILPGIKPSEAARIAYFFFYPMWSPAVGYGLYIMWGRNGLNDLLGAEALKETGGYNPLDTVRGLLAGRNLTAAQRIMYLYTRTYLATLLIQEDKMSMAHSVETRVPICDNEMVALSASTGIGHKLHGQELKAITKSALKDILPEELYRAPKRGFPTPIAPWFRGELKEFVRETLLDSKSVELGILDKKHIEGMLDRFFKYKINNLFDYNQASRIYSLMTVEYWMRTFQCGGWRELAPQ